MDARTKDEEVLHQLERLLDHEVRAIEEADDQFELLAVLDLAVIGGGIALVRSLLTSAGAVVALPIGVVVLLVLGFGLACAAFVVVMEDYLGWTARSAPDVEVGPSPDHLVAWSQDAATPSQELRLGLIEGYRGYVLGIEGMLESKTSARRVALYALFGSLLAFLAGTLILLAGQ